MALGPQKPSNGCPAKDFQVSTDRSGNVVVYPLHGVNPQEMMDWVARKLDVPDLPLTEQVIVLQNIIGRAMVALQGATGPTMEELKEFAGRMGFNLVPHGTGSHPLPGTDWVIARNLRHWAASQPGAHPAQPGLPAEEFWNGVEWTSTADHAMRFGATGSAILEMTDARYKGVSWRGCYLARVAAKPEPRYEVVDRP